MDGIVRITREPLGTPCNRRTKKQQENRDTKLLTPKKVSEHNTSINTHTHTHTQTHTHILYGVLFLVIVVIVILFLLLHFDSFPRPQETPFAIFWISLSKTTTTTRSLCCQSLSPEEK